MHFLFYSLSLCISLSLTHARTHRLTLHNNPVHNGKSFDDREAGLGLKAERSASGPRGWRTRVELASSFSDGEASSTGSHMKAQWDVHRQSFLGLLSERLPALFLSQLETFFPFDQSRRLIFKQKLISYVSLSKSLTTQGFSCSEKWSFLGCSNKLPLTEWLKATEIYSFPVLKVSGPKPGCPRDCAPSDTSRGGPFLASSGLWRMHSGPGAPWLVGTSLRSLPPSSRGLLPLCLFCASHLMKTPATRFQSASLLFQNDFILMWWCQPKTYVKIRSGLSISSGGTEFDPQCIALAAWPLRCLQQVPSLHDQADCGTATYLRSEAERAQFTHVMLRTRGIAQGRCPVCRLRDGGALGWGVILALLRVGIEIGHDCECSTATHLHSSHTLARSCWKSSKPGFSNTWTMNFQMFKLDLEKAEEPEIKLPTSVGSSKKPESSRKTSTFGLLTIWLLTIYWLLLIWLCGSQQTMDNSSRDGNTRPPDLPLEKSVCRSGSNS